MRIDVIGKNIEVTEPLKQHAVSRVNKFDKFFDRIQQVVVTLSKADHHKHGDFEAELRIDVEGHDDFVAHAHGADMYAVIDDVSHKASRQLHEYKERLKPGHHR